MLLEDIRGNIDFCLGDGKTPLMWAGKKTLQKRDWTGSKTKKAIELPLALIQRIRITKCLNCSGSKITFQKGILELGFPMVKTYIGSSLVELVQEVIIHSKITFEDMLH